MVSMTRRQYVDDDEIFDRDGNGPYDKRYPGKGVIADGGRVSVPLFLTDAAPARAAAPPRRYAVDARFHRPHSSAELYIDSAELRDAMQAAADARQSYVTRICDSWRSPSNPPPPAPRRGESPRDAYVRRMSTVPGRYSPPDPDEDDDRNGNGNGDDDGLSPRDEYIQRISNAYQATRGPYGWTSPPLPMGGGNVSPRHQANGNGNGDDDDAVANAIQAATMRRISPGGAHPGDEPAAIEAARRRRGSPGTSGVRFGPGSTEPGPTRDAAALADRDQAYAEMVAQRENAWRSR